MDKIKHAHECAEWDFLWIGPKDPEWQVCTCESNPQSCNECFQIEESPEKTTTPQEVKKCP